MRGSTIFIVCILFLGFILRFHHVTLWPRKGATYDEYAWTWLGMNILQRGVPISWSPHPQYTQREHYIDPGGARFWLVQPYLEHPPIFGLVAGVWAIISGAGDMYHVELIHIRSLALVLGTITIFLIYLFAKELYGLRVGIVSALFYAIAPTTVIGSRILQNENFFIPIFLFILFLVARYLKTEKKEKIFFSKHVLSIAALCGALVLAKVPWWSATVAVGFILFSYRKYTDALKILGVVVVCFSLFFIWGAFWNWDVFTNLWKLQLARYDITFDGILALFTTPYLVDRLFLDGWIYAGWFAFFSLLRDTNKHKILLLGLLGYFAVFAFAIPNEPGHGWYRYPFYPFLLIALAYVLIESIRERSLFFFFLVTCIGVTLLQHAWVPPFGFSYGVYRGYLLLSGLSGISLFFPGKRMEHVGRIASYMNLGVVVLLSVWTVVGYSE